MTKRIIAILLAAIMLLSLAACNGGGNTLPNVDGENETDDNGTQAPANNGSNTNESNDPEVYTPDADCPYGGAVGVGATSGTAYFDGLKVRDYGKAGGYLIDELTFEEGTELPTFTALGSSDAVTPNVVDDPIQAADEDAEVTNHAVSVAGGETLITGETIWNLYQVVVSVLPADENTVVDVYFCVQDANNYYVLSIGENGNTEVTCYKVTNGTKENAQFTVRASLSLNSFTPVSIRVNKESIEIYLNGSIILNLDNEEFETYGGPIPASVNTGEMEAPEGLTYHRVNIANVIHDGKGVYQNNADYPWKVFDNSVDTFYDCDATSGTPNVEAELAGIPGDGTFETSYVGVKFDTPTVVKIIRYAMRAANASRCAGSYIEGSVDGENWVVIAEVTETSKSSEFHELEIEDDTAYTYVRWVAGTGDSMYCNVAELEFWVAA